MQQIPNCRVDYKGKGIVRRWHEFSLSMRLFSIQNIHLHFGPFQLRGERGNGGRKYLEKGETEQENVFLAGHVYVRSYIHTSQGTP